MDAVTKRTLFGLMERLKAAEKLLTEENFQAVIPAVDDILEAVQALPENNSSIVSFRAWCLLVKGNALRELATGESRKTALGCIDEALSLWDKLPEQEVLNFRNHQTKAWMNRGMTFLAEGGETNLKEAGRSFEAAIKLRLQPELFQEPMIRYGLAAGWMNRGDVLTRLGGEGNLDEAVKSYDEALRVMTTLPVDANPLFRQRVAIACLNRGLTLEMVGTDAAKTEAMASFDASIAMLENVTSAPKQRQVLAAAWMNKGNGLLNRTPAELSVAREAARKAVECLDQTEREDITRAEIGLKARHVWCRALASLLEEASDPAAQEELFAEATDVADEGMAIIRHWHTRGVGEFGDLARDLFHFGARVYRVYQPHFVEEFLVENQGIGLPPKS